MSENVDLVRSIFESWERGDFSSAEWAHKEIEYVNADGPTPGSRAGLAGMAVDFRDLLSAWQDWRVGAEEYRELDDERVLVLNYFSGHGKTSRLEIGQLAAKGAQLFPLHDGKAVRIVKYRDR